MNAFSFILLAILLSQVDCFISTSSVSSKLILKNHIGPNNSRTQQHWDLRLQANAPPTSDNEEDGYGPVGSLLRQGPVPFFIRITNPDTYNAAVEKYMRLEKCNRITAQANMDAYFQDPNGWAYEKLKSRKTGLDIDYTKANMSKGSLLLTAVWSAGLFALIARIFAVQVLHQS